MEVIVIQNPTAGFAGWVKGIVRKVDEVTGRIIEVVVIDETEKQVVLAVKTKIVLKVDDFVEYVNTNFADKVNNVKDVIDAVKDKDVDAVVTTTKEVVEDVKQVISFIQRIKNWFTTKK
jgi:hypothetical protein